MGSVGATHVIALLQHPLINAALVGVLGAVIVAIVLGVRELRRGGRDRAAQDRSLFSAEEDARAVSVGARLGLVSASWPLGRIIVGRRAVSIGAATSRVVIHRHELVSIDRVRSLAMGGFEFHSDSSDESPLQVFGGPELEGALREAGWLDGL